MITPNENADHGTWQRIDYRSGKAAIIRRTSMSYDRLMQVVAEQAMQRAMVQINRRMSLVIAARIQRYPVG
jgi:hypothetical protein